MNIKKTYIPSRPRNEKIINPSQASGIFGAEASQIIGSTHEHHNKSILDQITGGNVHEHENLDILDLILGFIKENDWVELTDDDVLSALRVIKEIVNRAISKTDDDTAQGLIKFLKGAQFGEFSSGMMTGTGGRIDEHGNGELESLIIRSLLEVPELRYNRITLIGDEVYVGAGGVIEDVTPQEDPDVFLLKMKLEEGEMIPFIENDIIKGIFNHSGGNRTSWFRVDNVNNTEGTMLVTLGADDAVPSGQNYPPVKFMNIAKIGSFTDITRQSHILLSAKDGKIIMKDGVDNYMSGYISFQLGKPGGLESVIDFSKLPINENDSYAYVRGLLVQDILRIDYQGRPIKDIVDRGLWNLDTAINDPYRCTDTRQDDVWMPFGRYRCIVDMTTEMPGFGATDWVQVEGDPTLLVHITSTNGTVFRLTNISTTFIAQVFRGNEDITSTISPINMQWTRDSGDALSDTLWNNGHVGLWNTLSITDDDMGNNWFTERKVKFTFTAFVEDGVVSQTINISL